jgi:hypothetical protein
LCTASPLHKAHDPAQSKRFTSAAAALYELDAISSETSAGLGLVSLGAAVASLVAGFPFRPRIRLARDGMFVGLTTLGAWFLILVYALAQDTP